MIPRMPAALPAGALCHIAQIVADASPGDAAVQRELAAMREAVDSEAQAGFLGADTVNNNPLFRCVGGGKALAWPRFNSFGAHT